MSSTRYVLGVFGIMTVHGLVYAASGAVDGAIGAKVMQDAHHDGYNVLQSVRAGAAGGAVVGAAIGLAKEMLHLLDQRFHFIPREENQRTSRHFDQGVELLVAETVLAIGSMAASGALGYKMLTQHLTMTLQHVVIALTVGSAVLSAAALALLVCCCACVACCVKGGLKLKQSNTDDSAPDLNVASIRKWSLGSMLSSTASSAPAPEVVEVPAYTS